MRGQLYINGQWTNGNGENFLSTNPVSNKLIWQGNEADQLQINSAVNAAQQAFYSWSNLDFKRREDILAKYTKLLEKNKEKFAELIGSETGKPLWESRTEVATMIGKFVISVKSYHERTGDLTDLENNSGTMLKHKPHGVVAIFGPYNFPGHLPNGHMIPALLAGNTVILKPSRLTPAVAELMVEYLVEAGLPSGVVNLIHGSGSLLANHQNLNGIFFTGSFATGLKIQKNLVNNTDKILALEMGGNNPLVITNNITNIKAAVYNAIQSIFISAGQRCTCARRLILIKSARTEDFIEKFVAAVEKLKVDNYDATPEPFCGAVISSDAADEILNKIQERVEAGGKVILKCKKLQENTGLLSPGIIDMTESMFEKDEEIFGPVVQLFWVDDLAEAIQLANSTEYGLSAGLFGNKQEFEEFYKKTSAGVINWNKPTTGASSAMPFGGVGNSGNHRPSAYYAADYCAYPVASMLSDELVLPEELLPGITL